jgi:hypothetical protein
MNLAVTDPVQENSSKVSASFRDWNQMMLCYWLCQFPSTQQTALFDFDPRLQSTITVPFGPMA